MPYRVTERAEARRRRMRARIVAAATRLMLERGYDATSLREVVTLAGTSIGNCYFYFPTKEALLSAAVAAVAADVATAIDAAMATVRSHAAQAAIGAYTAVSAALTMPEVGRLIFVEGARVGSRSTVVRIFGERVRAFFAARPRLARAKSPELLAHTWLGAIVHVVEGGLSGALPGTPEELGRDIARWNLHALDLPRTEVEAALRALDRHIAKEAAA